MRISDWSSDVCSSDLDVVDLEPHRAADRLDHAPARIAFLEPADGLVDGEPALDLELRIDSGAGALERRARHVRAEDRSEERRVGNEWGSTCRSRWSPYHQKKKTRNKKRKQATK